MKKVILLIISACFLLSSCDINVVTPDTTEETLPVIATSETVTTDVPDLECFPVIVNGVEISDAPERVVSLSPSHTEILFEMGYGDFLVGRSTYCDYPEAVSSITDVGRPSKPDLNAIISLKPDLLLTATSIPLKDQYKLEEYGIKVLYIPYPSSIEEFERIYSAFGLIFEGTFDGEEIGKQYFNSIENAFSQAEIELEEFVYITENLSVATGDTFESNVLSCFGSNVAESSVDYSYPKEYLIEFQPEIVLLNSDYTIDDLFADEVYCQLDAVLNGKVFYVDNSYFERPSARITEIIDIIKSIE